MHRQKARLEVGSNVVEVADLIMKRPIGLEALEAPLVTIDHVNPLAEWIGAQGNRACKIFTAKRVKSTAIHVVSSDAVTSKRKQPPRAPCDIDRLRQWDFRDDLKRVGTQRDQTRTTVIQNP